MRTQWSSDSCYLAQGYVPHEEIFSPSLSPFSAHSGIDSKLMWCIWKKTYVGKPIPPWWQVISCG